MRAATLVMDGPASLEIMPLVRASFDVIAAATPDTRQLNLEGRGHDLDQAAIAPGLGDFFREPH